LKTNTRNIIEKGCSSRPAFMKSLMKNMDLYLLLVPGFIYILIFKYIPIAGLIIAFQEYNIFDGIKGSEWVGFQHFIKIFHSEDFFIVFRNTLLISIYKLIIIFPIPIVIAILLNESRWMPFKKTVQTIIYLPHFLSWVIISGIFINILSPSGGIVNEVIKWFGGQSVMFMADNRYFRSVLVSSSAWQGVGWTTIVYIAAIAGIDPTLYESAVIDGAGRIKQIIYITLPNIASTVVLMLILRLGHILSGDKEQVLMMYNPIVYKVGDIIETFVYRIGLGKMEYSFSTAVGLFNSFVGFALICIGNIISKKLVQKSIW
jgi:putative aldouronate transport system permease protein